MLLFGHVMRANGLGKEMMLACEEGRRERGLPVKRWMEGIHSMSGMDLEELRYAAEDRGIWRRTTTTVARIHNGTR